MTHPHPFRDNRHVGYQAPQFICHHAIDDTTLHRLSHNDAGIANLFICSSYSRALVADRKAILGRAISNSDHLREVSLSGDVWELEYYFRWIAHNRSIEIFRSLNVFYSDRDFAVLSPFFEHNPNLRCIELIHGNASRCIPTIISALSHSEMLRLARIDIRNGKIDDKNAFDLINTLNAMPGLSNLLDLWLEENLIERNGCRALCELLKNPECRVISLELSLNLFDDECIGILVGGFVECGTLKNLSIGNRGLTTAGWNTFSIYVSSSRCLLEVIVLNCIIISDEDATSLADSLSMKKTLKCLGFCDDDPTEWNGIVSRLAPTSTILELSMNDANLNDDDAFVLFSNLANNSTLKKLSISLYGITSAGWVACFRQLIDSRSVLAEMNFEWSLIDDEGVSILVNLVAGHMDTVSTLKVSGESISANGWSKFANVLVPSSTSKLKTLTIGQCPDPSIHININTDVVIDLVSALAGNTTLEALNFSIAENEALWLDALYLDMQWLYAMFKVLCDLSSISSVCQSNHTIHAFQLSDLGTPRELYWLLEWNKDTDKTQVVRKKLLLYYFYHVDNIGREFGGMATSIMPNVVEWIGRDRLGYSVMFEFCRSVPALFKCG